MTDEFTSHPHPWIAALLAARSYDDPALLTPFLHEIETRKDALSSLKDCIREVVESYESGLDGILNTAADWFDPEAPEYWEHALLQSASPMPRHILMRKPMAQALKVPSILGPLTTTTGSHDPVVFRGALLFNLISASSSGWDSQMAVIHLLDDKDLDRVALARFLLANPPAPLSLRLICAMAFCADMTTAAQMDQKFSELALRFLTLNTSANNRNLDCSVFSGFKESGPRAYMREDAELGDVKLAGVELAGSLEFDNRLPSYAGFKDPEIEFYQPVFDELRQFFSLEHRCYLKGLQIARHLNFPDADGHEIAPDRSHAKPGVPSLDPMLAELENLPSIQFWIALRELSLRHAPLVISEVALQQVAAASPIIAEAVLSRRRYELGQSTREDVEETCAWVRRAGFDEVYGALIRDYLREEPASAAADRALQMTNLYQVSNAADRELQVVNFYRASDAADRELQVANLYRALATRLWQRIGEARTAIGQHRQQLAYQRTLPGRLARSRAYTHQSNEFRSSTGFVYILRNPSISGMVKIGYTTRTVQERVNELSRSTSVPTPFQVVEAFHFGDAPHAEQQIHSRLTSKKVKKVREFFEVAEDVAVQELVQLHHQMEKLNS